ERLLRTEEVAGRAAREPCRVADPLHADGLVAELREEPLGHVQDRLPAALCIPPIRRCVQPCYSASTVQQAGPSRRPAPGYMRATSRSGSRGPRRGGPTPPA